MSFARGFQAGYETVRDIKERRRRDELREGLKRAGQLEPTQQMVTDPEMVRNLEAAGRNPQTGQPYYTVRDGYVQPNFTYESTQPPGRVVEALGPDQISPGTGIDRIPVVEPGARPSAEVSQVFPGPIALPQTTQYRLGGLTRAEAFSPAEVQRARTEEMARVYEQQGMPEEAMRMRQLAQQQELTGLQRQQVELQLSAAQRQQQFTQAIDNVFKGKYDKPEDQTAAVLEVYRQYDPQAAVQLENSFTQGELNRITLNAKKFETEHKQARMKGVDAVIKWYDGINDGFVLRREGNVIYRTEVNERGEPVSRESVFIQGANDRDLMMQLDAYATPGGFLEAAKTQAEINKLQAQAEQARETAAYLQRDRPRAGGLTTPEIKETDIRAYLEMYGDTVIPGAQGADRRPRTLRELPPAEQRAYIMDIIRGGGGTQGLPGLPEGGLPRPGAAPSTPAAAPPATPATGQGLVRSLEQSLPPARPSVGGRTPSRVERIPEPPRQYTRGGRINPDYLEWERQFGERYRAQQR